jgi:sodium-dependent phosphate cotransporter
MEQVHPQAPGRVRLAGAVRLAVKLGAALFLFILALQVMKTGAASLSILQGDGFLVRSPWTTLGLGWLGALLVLSGSPVAASALALVGAGAISEVEGFTMLTGSRLGAAFVVLLVAVLYALRGGEGERMKPVSTAVMALVTTALIYVPGSLIGYALLRWQTFRGFNISFPAQFDSVVDLIYGPIIESSKLGWLKKKWPMFGLGCLVALISMSVSVALTILVPLVVKGYVKRDAILPYIMGANITTLGDTLLAAFLLDSPAAVRIVIAQIIGTTIVSVFLLALFYIPVRRGVWKFQRQMVRSKPRLAMFTAGLFTVPLAIIFFGNVG